MKTLGVLLGATLMLSFLASCGTGEAEVLTPRAVADGLVPDTIAGGRLAFAETKVEEARLAFTEAGDDSLASDGRLWELRIGDRLVGVLQLTTLDHDVDLQDDNDRESIVKQLLPTARDRFDVGDVTIWSTASQGKTIYLWFGRGMFALFTLKPASGDEVDPETTLAALLDHMVATDAWEYEYFDPEDL